MLHNIYNTNDDFPFSNMNISKPVALNGGNHFIKFSLNDMPVYVNPPKCFLKSIPHLRIEEKKIKRTNCDFIFSQEHDDFLRWIENLEEFAQTKIYENRNQWFESTLEQEDIENSFTSPLKVIKSGKQYSLRVSIPQTKLGDKNGFKIFNEDEQELIFDDINETRPILCVLEICGIKFSSKNFQIEINVKQMMALNEVVDLFEKCILLKKIPTQETNSSETQDSIVIKKEELGESIVIKKEELGESIVIKKEELGEPVSVELAEPIEETVLEQPVAIVEESIMEESLIKQNGLDEVEIDLDNISTENPITLKQRNDVYYEMYMEARRKAKIARDLALSAYLEARRIKNTYMLNDIMDSEDEDDESEMEELEESDELEELDRLENRK
jgi:hypothetical protein